MKIKKNSDIVIHKENGGQVLLNLRNGNFYGLYDLSNDIWDMLDNVNDSQTIIDALVKKYAQESSEVIVADVTKFIEELSQEGIIEIYE